MNITKMFSFHAFVLLFCVTSVLTSSVNDETGANSLFRKTEETGANMSMVVKGEGGPIHVMATSQSNAGNNQMFIDAPNTLKHDQNDTSISIPDSIKDTSQEKNINSVVPRKGVQPKIVPRKGADQSNYREDVLQESNTSSTIQKKGNQPKIVPRKGADKESYKEIKNMSVEKSIHSTDSKSAVETTNNTQVVVDQDTHLNYTDTKAVTVQSHNTSDNIPEKNASTIDVPEKKQLANTTTTIAPTTRRTPKPKPTATFAIGIDDNTPIRSSTKSPPLGMPRKIDYIVPIVITMIAAPLLGAAGYLIYRQGRDCWDKRHYRRMDFLIDGMYNY